MEELEFEKCEPYRPILNLIEHYYSIEEYSKTIVKEIIAHLLSIISSYLKNYATSEAIDTLTEYLNKNHLFFIRNIIDLLVVYMQDKKTDNLVMQEMIDCYMNKEDHVLITRALILLKKCIVQKNEMLNDLMHIENYVKSNLYIECLEDIISNLCYLLFFIQWETIYASKAINTQKEDIKEELKLSFNTAYLMWDVLRPSKEMDTFEQTEQLILNFLFASCTPEGKVLGRKVYMALLAQLLSSSECSHKVGEDPFDIVLSSLNNIPYFKFKLIYRKILLNIGKFQVCVQEKILGDLHKFLSNSHFLSCLLNMDDVFHKLFALLREQENLVIMPLKRVVIDVIKCFLNVYIKDKQKRELVQNSITIIKNLSTNIKLEIIDKFLGMLLKDPLGLDEVLINVMQFVYLIEDISLKLGPSLSEKTFIEVMGKLILYLNEIRMLYFWYSPLVMHGEVNEVQREGGVVRIILKVLMGIILYMPEKGSDFHCELALDLLKFFLYHKRSTHVKVAEALGLALNLPSIKEDSRLLLEDDNEIEDGFIGKDFNPEKEQMHSKILYPQREEHDNNYFNQHNNRVIYMFTQLAQTFIYTSYNVKQYKHINNEKYTSITTSYKSNKLAKMLGKILSGISISDIQQIIESLGTLSTEQDNGRCYYSSIDFFYTTTIEESPRKARILLNSKRTLNASWKKCLKASMSVLTKIKNAYSEGNISQLTKLLLSKEFVQEVIKMLHRVITKNLIKVDIMVQLKLIEENIQITPFRLSKSMITKLADIDNILNQPSIIQIHDNKEENVEEILINESKVILKERGFVIDSKRDKEIYRTIANEYKKKYSLGIQEAGDGFVKLELAYDNLGRQMRFKRLKDPLTNTSILKGIKYMRWALLKRFLIRQLLANKDIFPLVQNKYMKEILISLLKKPTLRRNLVLTSISDEEKCIKELEVDVIKFDYSLFGTLKVFNTELIFTSRQKDIFSLNYKLGPVNNFNLAKQASIIKVWQFTDIAQIILRKYNLIKQAIEIFFKNGKSVFLVVYPNEDVTFLLKLLKNSSIQVIEDPKAAFRELGWTDKWINNEISTFEYLMHINHYAGRSLKDLTQYFIFPWIISDYQSKNLSTEDTKIYRDLKQTIAGSSDKKIAEGNAKLDNTGEQFQFESHYMTSRIVLLYLARIQPYTKIIPTAFHSLDVLWKNVFTKAECNYELVPEFFYNPEIFINKY